MSPFLAGWFALFIGAYNISPAKIISLVGNLNIPEKAIIIDIRLHRIILAGLVGAALAGSGVTLQGIFRNPLVDPFILGISAGAGFGCALSIGFFPELPTQFIAFIFGIAAVIFTYSIAKTQVGISRLSLILSGVVISAFFTAMISEDIIMAKPKDLERLHIIRKAMEKEVTQTRAGEMRG